MRRHRVRAAAKVEVVRQIEGRVTQLFGHLAEKRHDKHTDTDTRQLLDSKRWRYALEVSTWCRNAANAILKKKSRASTTTNRALATTRAPALVFWANLKFVKNSRFSG